jgi:glycosyltransferase involved in cell wall biosynthesis
MSPPRVQICTATFLPFVGGVELRALAEARMLRERGRESTILTFKHQRAWPARDTIQGVPVIRLAGILLVWRRRLPRPLQRGLYLLALIMMGCRLWRLRRKYDLLHVYQLSALVLPAALVGWLARKPMVVSVCSAEAPPGQERPREAILVAGELDPNTPWLRIEDVASSNGDFEALRRLGRPLTRFTRWLLQRTDAVILYPSRRIEQCLAEHDLLLSGARISPFGVDIERFGAAADNTFDGRAKTVMCVAMLRYQKGVDALLQAWRLVHSECPDARLIIVGNSSAGTEAVQAGLLRLATALDLMDTVEFADLRSDTPAQLHRGAIFILPSRWEGMPNALLEAMSCGLACIGTRVSGTEDLIQHEVNGLLVEVDDYQGMAHALLRLLKHPELIRKLGEAARQTIEQQYASDRIFATRLDLYDTMMHRGPKSLCVG